MSQDLKDDGRFNRGRGAWRERAIVNSAGREGGKKQGTPEARASTDTGRSQANHQAWGSDSPGTVGQRAEERGPCPWGALAGGR